MGEGWTATVPWLSGREPGSPGHGSICFALVQCRERSRSRSCSDVSPRRFGKTIVLIYSPAQGLGIVPGWQQEHGRTGGAEPARSRRAFSSRFLGASAVGKDALLRQARGSDTASCVFTRELFKALQGHANKRKMLSFKDNKGVGA